MQNDIVNFDTVRKSVAFASCSSKISAFMFTPSSQKNKPRLGQLLSEVMKYQFDWLLIFNIPTFVQIPMSANVMKMAATRMPTASTLKAVVTVVAKRRILGKWHILSK